MKIKALFFLFSLLLTLSYAQTPNWAWAQGIGGNIGIINQSNGSTLGTNVTTDANGNVYSIGYFETPTMVVGGYTLTNNNTSGYKAETFIIKYDAAGNVLWAKSIHGDSSDIGTGIVVDNAFNIYITGDFASPTLAFDTKTLTNTANGTDDIFLAKYNSAGNIIWAKNYGGSRNDIGNSLIVDNLNNIYLTGNFSSQNLAIGSTILTIDSLGNQDMFLAKFDTSGTPVYVKAFGKGCHIPIMSNDITSDASNNIYVTGFFNTPETIIGSDTLHCNPNSDNFFITKLDASGNIQWTRSGGGSNYDIVVNGVAVDPIGNLYTCGYFAGNSFAIGTTTLTSTCCLTGFVAKYSSSGNALWAKSTLVNNPQAGWPMSCIATDNNYGIYIGGGFFNQVNNLPPLVFGSDTLINGTPGMDAIFIAKYDSAGNPLWGKTANSIKWNNVTEITTDKYGNLFAVGAYDSPTIIFDNDTLHNLNSNMWTTDYFIAKIGAACVGIKNITENKELVIYPNPTSEQLFIDASTTDKLSVDLFDVNGTQLFTKNINSKSNIDVTMLENGIYTLTIKAGGRVTIKKIVIVR